MNRILKTIGWVAAVGVLEFYFMNFYYKPTLKQAAKALITTKKNHIVDIGGHAPDHLVYVYNHKKYVWIQARWYHFNKKHVYMINGIPTLFIYNRAQPDAVVSSEAGTLVWDRKVITNLNQMMENSPLEVYSPHGIKTLVKGFQGAQGAIQAEANNIEHQTH